ncbi:MAG: hypothetical protein J0M11_12360 [Anaerolineae bacterium]|nr:hypothetical protein [Anaerolineae bacterium]
MFFGKKDKPASPKRPVRITILTDEYIIDALDDPELSILQAVYDSEVDDASGGVIVLKDATLRSLRQPNAAARSFSEWRLPSLVSIIAILSDDPVAQELIREGWEDYETPFKAFIYAGAYNIEGTIFSEEDTPPDFMIRTFAPLEDATVTYPPDAKRTSLRGRWGVVNSVLMHGFSIEK